MKIVRRILWLSLLFSIILLFAAFGYYYAVTRKVSLIPEKLVLNEQTAIVYDGNGCALKNIAAENWNQMVKISDIPAHTKQAFVDTEDKRFYSHGGFDVKRIARAAWNNAKAGAFKEGASTISQQLIKNTHLTQEKTFTRKLREWKLTRQLEKRYSKDEILEKYLNSIYFGHSCFGIGSATEFYFNKSPKDLTLGESAILAGLVKSPNNYSPFKHPDRCQKRKATVLQAMFRNGSINESAKTKALDEQLPVQKPQNNRGNYAQFVFEELTELSELHRFTVGGKIEIGTYLDQDLQAQLEKLSKEIQVGCEKAFYVLDTTSHGFKACVSDVGEIRRLPGSAIKPLLVYAPALEENVLSPATPLLDQKVSYDGYSPDNYDGVCHGYVSTRECVEKSLNIPAVKTLDALGVQKGAEYLKRLGLPLEKDDASLALALGGMKKGFTLKELTRAYSALQNGTLCECGFISFVKINGETVYRKPTDEKRVFSEESAYLMTDMLKSTAKCGTAKKLRGLPFDIAAKTGTVGTEKGNTDAYALSYTTRDCVSVWLGNADNAKIEHTGGGVPCNILLHIHEYLYKSYQDKKLTIPPFTQPKEVVCVALDKTNYYDTHTLVLADDLSPAEYKISELFKKSAIPLNKSTSFSNPQILPPRVQLVDGRVIVELDKNSPRYYTYKIERTDYARHTTILYEGAFQERIVDNTIQKDEYYIYTITVAYKDRTGEPVTLPAVYTGAGEKIPPDESKILGKDWWDY